MASSRPSTMSSPDWTMDDRVGVIVTDPFGLLGASLLVQRCIVRYLDYRREHFDRKDSLLDAEGERRPVEESSGELKGKQADPLNMAERGSWHTRVTPTSTLFILANRTVTIRVSTSHRRVGSTSCPQVSSLW